MVVDSILRGFIELSTAVTYWLAFVARGPERQLFLAGQKSQSDLITILLLIFYNPSDRQDTPFQLVLWVVVFLYKIVKISESFMQNQER